MYPRIFRTLFNNPNHWLWRLVEMVSAALTQGNEFYQPHQEWEWHSSYSGKTADPQMRRARREASLPYEWTRTYRAWLKNMFNHTCVYCGRRKCQFHLDHIIPVSWATCPGATVDNAALACSGCNMDRGNKDLADWHLETFGSPARTRAVVDKIWKVQAEARARWGPAEGSERRAMQTEGRRDLMKTTRRFINAKHKGKKPKRK